jgi:hypothetical protein
MIREFTLDTPESVRKALHIKANAKTILCLRTAWQTWGVRRQALRLRKQRALHL